MNCVQECVDFFKTCFGQGLDLSDSVIDHCCKLLPFIHILFGRQVEFIEDDFTNFDDLLMCQLKVLIRNWHPEIRVDQIRQPIYILITDNWG